MLGRHARSLAAKPVSASCWRRKLAALGGKRQLLGSAGEQLSAAHSVSISTSCWRCWVI